MAPKAASVVRAEAHQFLLADHDELRAHWREDRRFEPRMSTDERDRRRRLWRKAVSKSLDWVDDDARVLMGTTDDGGSLQQS